MKKPSKNISTSLAGQRVGGREPEPITVSKQRPATAAGMQIPGEGGVSHAPGVPEPASARRYAAAHGRRFGGGA